MPARTDNFHMVSAAKLWRRGLVFLAVFFSLQIGWQSLHDTTIERVVLHRGTAEPAAALVNLVTPAIHARALGSSIQGFGSGVSIQNGCEGLDALFLLLAALAAAPMPWAARGWGLLWGAILVFSVNQARILVLFYADRHDKNLFDCLHDVIAPIAVILVVSGFFYAWLQRANRRSTAAA
jgi:exosortase/archaeosortase family protein